MLLFKVIKNAVDTLRKSAEKFLAARPASSIDVYKQELMRYVQPLNMLAYVLWLAVTEAEKAEIEQAKNRGRVKKEKNVTPEGWVAESSLKDKTMVSILQLLDLELARFWSLTYPESEFCLLWTKIGAAMMENQANVKLAAVKSNVFMLFAKLVLKYDQHISIAHVITEQLHNHAHVAKPYAAMLEDMATKHDNSQFVGDVVREIGHADLAALSKDTNAAKNFAAFLVNLATMMPKTVLQNISMFMPHMDAELYVIRNGMIDTMGQLVLHAFDNSTGNAGAKEDSQQTRNKLLECLQERFLDNNAFCRSRTMDVWASLIEARGIVPMDFVTEITNQTVRRLHDKGALVRKRALQLLTTLIKNNPFCPSLNVSALKARLEKELPRYEAASAAVTASLLAPNKENDPAPLLPQGEGEAVAPAPPARTEVPRDQIDAVKEWGLMLKTIAFAETMDSATHVMCKLLGSKNKSDLQEVIKFFTTAKEHYLESADHGFRKMLVLLWNEEKGVKEAVVQSYKETYLSVGDIPKGTQNPAQYACFQMAQKLIALTAGATLAQLTSLEVLMAEFLKADLIPQGVIDTLWNIFCGATSHTVKGVDVPDSRGAIILLSMVAAVHPETVRDNIEKLARVGLLDKARWVADPFFAKYVCLTLQKMVAVVGTQFSADHALFKKLMDLLLTWEGPASGWCQSAEQVVNSIYVMCDAPHSLMEPLIRDMATHVLQDGRLESVSVDGLSRLLFLVGHVALKELLLVEAVRIQQQAKRQAKSAKESNSEDTATKKKSKDQMEDELGMDEQNAALEDEYLGVVADKQIVCNNLLGLFGPILQLVLLNKEGRYGARTLQAVASLSLAKFMSVSLTFCKANLQLLFSVLEHSEDDTIRSNIMIALGDLSFRFPNLIEAWNPSIYARLQDKSPHVRKTTIMVLSHLILNGVIKIKNNGGLLALAVIDDNPRINEYSRHFFLKLSLTDKGIYNALPDIVSYLSSHQPRLDDASFRQIVQFVFGFIQTEAETVSLIEKLCHRFTSNNGVQQWRDIACCLSMLTFNEKAIRKLYACATSYKEICHDDAIYLHFQEMINKSKRANQQASHEVQKIIDECYMKHHPNSSLPTGETVKAKGRAAAGAAAKSKRKRRGGAHNDDDDEDDGDDGDSSSLEEEEDNVVASSQAVATATAASPAKAPPKKAVAKAKAAPKAAKKKAAATPPKKAVVAVARPKRAGRAVAAAPAYIDDDDDDDDEMSFSSSEE